MNYQNLLLVGLAVGGFYLLTRNKKSAVAQKSSSQGGGGGAIGGGYIGGTTLLPIGRENTQSNILVTDLISTTPTINSCISNPNQEGCGKLLPNVNLQEQQASSVAVLEPTRGDSKLNQTNLEQVTSTSSGVKQPSGLTTTSTPTTPTITTPSTTTASTSNLSPTTKSGFSGNRADGYYDAEVSRSRRRGISDKYDFDGEYGTFINDMF